MCELAARAPASVRPAFTTAMGLARETRRARSMKRRGLPRFSRYRRITCVAGSSAQCSMRSLPETSALLPTLTNCETPTPSSLAWSRIARPSAPDCDEKATLPKGGSAVAKVALSDTSGSALTTPRQLGPTMRML